MSRTKVIDVHTHVFPTAIRDRAISAIGEYYTREMFGSGSLKDLLDNGDEINVVKYVIHSIATKPNQVETINNYVADLQDKNECFIGFGTIHPKTKDISETIDEVISLGLVGIKLHPEFQNFNIDDPHMLPIYEAIEDRLPLLVHMGDENTTSSSPERLSNILEMFPSLTVIAPHLGGYTMWDEVIEKLVGKNLYFDTSSALRFIDKEKAIDIIRTHGTDKVLFGTDYPMWLHNEELPLLYELGLTEEENEQILYSNAAKLLGVE